MTLVRARRTAAEWAAANPVLPGGKLGFATDTGDYRCGDGVTQWLDLPVEPSGGSAGGSLVFTDAGLTNEELVTFTFDDGTSDFTATLSLSSGIVTDTAGDLTITESGLYRIEPRLDVGTAGVAPVSPALKLGFDSSSLTILSSQTGAAIAGSAADDLNPSVYALEAGAVLTVDPGGSDYSDWDGLSVGFIIYKLMTG